MIPIDSEVMMVDTNQLKYILHDTWASPPLLLEIFPPVSTQQSNNQSAFIYLWDNPPWPGTSSEQLIFPPSDGKPDQEIPQQDLSFLMGL